MLSRKGLSLVVAICMRHVFASCGHGTTLQPRSQNGPVDVNTFGYFGPKGPTSWVALDPVKNARCGNGTRQSPINVVPGSLSVIPGAQISIKIPDMPKGADFENRGTTVEVVAEGGTMSIGGVRYTLKQFHFHLPSEHLDNGMSMAMEVHMVWQGDAGKVAVVGFYVDIEDGSSAPNSQPITKRLSLEEKRLLDTRTAGKQENYASQRGLVEASNVLGTVLASVEKIAKPGTRVKTQPLMMSKLVGALSSGSFQT
ncbi:hypothetical protein QQS21_003399 [Conoideocrella luteorostrata]|uniref:carbonic anhydrase n=1 Tax=Conoideocrella luteorostrata TaxID=1105319 RepID=A0AAJ0FWF5_9HYPO|nr:hypothetical protein QQS21_003399 [Conoideocrella luteorostrata]